MRETNSGNLLLGRTRHGRRLDYDLERPLHIDTHSAQLTSTTTCPMPRTGTDLLCPPEPQSQSEAAAISRADVRPHMSEALALLLQAHDYALELGQDSWDMAVELEILRSAKLSNSDLRWLLAKGYIDHAVEATGAEDAARHFRRSLLLKFSAPTCVVLTRSGVAVAREALTSDQSNVAGGPQVSICQLSPADELTERPKWDEQRRQLRVGRALVKEFKLPSPNQETVLMAFEEEGWPPRIDDPLPPVAQLDPRRRLHDTIKALNRKQKHGLIRFRGDGSGEGIRWEPLNS